MRNPEEMSFLEHLEDFRKMLIRCAAILILSMAVCIPFAPQILDFLFRPLRELDVDPKEFLVTLEVLGGFRVAVALIFWSGLLLATPFIVFFIAQFIFPGLHRHEKRIARRSAFAAVLLFFLGAALGYFGTVHQALDALYFQIPEWLGAGSELASLTSYIEFVIKLPLGFGLAFQLPLILLALGYADLISAASLRTHRRHVFVGLLILAMMFTPPEPISQLVMACSLYIFYEICIVMIRLHEKKNPL